MKNCVYRFIGQSAFYSTLILLRSFQQHYCYNVTDPSQECEGCYMPKGHDVKSPEDQRSQYSQLPPISTARIQQPAVLTSPHMSMSKCVKYYANSILVYYIILFYFARKSGIPKFHHCVGSNNSAS